MASFIATKQRFLLLQRLGTYTKICVSQQTATVSTSPSPCPMDDKDEQTLAKSYDTIPGPRGIYNIPYIGFLFHLKPFGKYTSGTMDRLFDEMIQKYGPIFKIRTNTPVVVITDPKDLATMLRSEGKYPLRPNFDILNVYHKRTGSKPTVGALQGPEWWALRQPTQKALLRPKQISQYLPMMNEVADDFIQMLKGGYLKKNDIEETCMLYMAETAGTAFYNKRLGFLGKDQSEEAKKMQDSLVNVFDLILKTLIGNSNGFKYYRSKDYRKFESAMDYLRASVARYVNEAKDDLKRKELLGTLDPNQPNMILSLQSELSDEEVALIVEGLYFAAVDSSAAGLQIVLHTLAKYQDKQEKLRAELRDVLGISDGNTPVTQEHLDKMPYLKACVKEVYRLSRIVPFGPVRILPTDVVLGGYNIPAGVQIYNYNAKACRDETIFEDPESYEPERWLRQNKRVNNETGDGRNNKGDNDSSWAVLPFGLGPRMCPGRRLFEQELFLLLAKLIRNTRVGLEPESVDEKFEYRLFLRSVKPLKFTFTPLDVKQRSL